MSPRLEDPFRAGDPYQFQELECFFLGLPRGRCPGRPDGFEQLCLYGQDGIKTGQRTLGNIADVPAPDAPPDGLAGSG